ncbi:hypothetical protein OVW19_27465, partial [Klebsiella pneumoniae]|uniref:hypothetical protein n=1 Tax=Klebsiella pneumoniae TaxID=573 RepID=UPI00227078FA
KNVTISSILRFATLPTTTEDAQDIVITFKETKNETDNPALCAVPNHTGSAPCEDFFSFDFGSLVEPIEITHEGKPYLIEFRIDNVQNAFVDLPNSR